MTRIGALLTAAAVATALVSATALAQTPITYGTLDNFDVINDTGVEGHGFEIELEGIVPADVVYTFGTPYIRYGDPTVVGTATGVIVRYSASYDATTHTWNAATPIAVPPYLPTTGHSCWTGGVTDPAIYYTSGCDHFGLSLNAAPTKTTYRWLVEGTPGTLVAFGSNVTMPAPTWNVTPPAPGVPAAVVAVIEPPPPDRYEFGDALWVKVFVTELPDSLQGDDLAHMVIDDPAVDIVPNEPAEVEFEWVVLQQSVNGGGEQPFGGEVGAASEAVSRRFEFYKYTGAYDAETHEALCDNPIEAAQQIPSRCGSPDLDGVAGVGALIGTQNVALNLAGEFGGPVNHAPIALCASPTVEAGNACTAPASINNFSYDPDGDAITLVQLPAGPFSLGSSSAQLTVTDSHAASASCSSTVTVVDSIKPQITAITASPSLLIKANAKMIPVTLAVTASDSCTTTCRITSVTSSELDTGVRGDKSPDVNITGDLTVALRAQVDKQGTGSRDYVIHVDCSDASGNATTGTTTVTVRK